MVGGRLRKSPFNLATNGQRQPGSSFKPFTLMTALEEGISPPRSSSRRFRRSTFGKRGNERSSSVTTTRITTSAHARSKLRRPTSPTTRSMPSSVSKAWKARRSGSYALDREDDPRGRLQRPDLDQPGDGPRRPQEGVSPLGWAYAYSTIGNNGDRVSGTMAPVPGDSPVAFTEVTDKDGHLIKGGDNDSIHTQAFDQGTAEEAKRILETVVSSGTGTHAQIGAEGQWGKTGTTENNGDAWFCGGIADEVTACVWVGYPDSTTPMTTLYAGGPVIGGTFPALIWAGVISAWQDITSERAAEAKAKKEAKETAKTPAPPKKAPPKNRTSPPAPTPNRNRLREEAAPEPEAPRDPARRNRKPRRNRAAVSAAAPAAPRPPSRRAGASTRAGCRRGRSARGAPPPS